MIQVYRIVQWVFFATIISGSVSLSASGEPEISIWKLEGIGAVEASAALLERARGTANPYPQMPEETIAVSWTGARMHADGADSIEVDMTVALVVGTSFKVGTTTPYPGVITKLVSAHGEITALASGQTVELRMSERGSWVGKLLHSDARGPNHLAAEIPFSLFDKKTGQLVAENTLLFGFDLGTESKPIASPALIGPTPFSDLRLQSSDMRSAFAGQSALRQRNTYASAFELHGAISSTEFWTRSKAHRVHELFDVHEAGSYGCETGDFIKLELKSDGLTSSGNLMMPEITLEIEFSPAMVGDHETYFETLTGELTFQQESGVRVLSIAPGNHGSVASRAVIRDDEVVFDLGVAMREGGYQPIVARLEIRCRASAGLLCESMSLSPAIDDDRRSLSPAPLADLFDHQRSSVFFSGLSKAIQPAPLGGGRTCDFTCPTCKPEGCDQGNFCDIAGAPINCTAGCDHRSSAAGCCRGGGSRLCCQVCGTPP